MAAGFKEGFITHLTLTGMWTQYDMQPQDIDLYFNEPVNFREMEDILITESRAGVYNQFKEDDFFHKRYLAERFLKMTPEEFKRNEFFKNQTQGAALPEEEEGGGSTSFGDGGGSGLTGAPITDEEEEVEPEIDLGNLGGMDEMML
jgi:hypothetical protein